MRLWNAAAFSRPSRRMMCSSFPEEYWTVWLSPPPRGTQLMLVFFYAVHHLSSTGDAPAIQREFLGATGVFYWIECSAGCACTGKLPDSLLPDSAQGRPLAPLGDPSEHRCGTPAPDVTRILILCFSLVGTIASLVMAVPRIYDRRTMYHK
jgi:hypothetical protein